MNNNIKETLSLIESSGCEYGILCRELDSGEPLVSLNQDTVFPSASIIKVPIMLALMERHRLGVLDLDVVIDVPTILDDSRVFENGTVRASYRELCVWMIIQSDNTSTNALIGAIGFDVINEYISNTLGLKQTVLRRKMLDFASRDAGMDNTTSASDMFALFRKLFSGEILNPRLQNEAISILLRQRSKNLLFRYIWEEASLAHKTGGLDNLTHDAGVFMFSDKRVFTGVFLWNTKKPEGEPRLIGRFGRGVYDYYSNGRTQ